VYSFRKKIRFKRRKKDRNKYLLPRFLKHYYLILKLDDLRTMQTKAVTKPGNFESNFLKLLECRLFMLVFRLN
jgi:ribosomal protein S4